MAIPTTFSPVKPQDVSLIPIPVYKHFEISNSTVATTSSGYSLVEGVYTGVITPIGSPKSFNDPTNSIDNSYQSVIWKSVDHLYYRSPYDIGKSFEHSNRRYTYKRLGISASYLSIPYNDHGEGIKPGSFSITSSFGYNIKEDSNGNLYDDSIDSGSFTNPRKLVSYWGFNDEFRKFKYTYGTYGKAEMDYVSRVFEPDTKTIVKNAELQPGVKINNTSSAFGLGFDSTAYCLTRDRKEYSFDSSEDFTLSLWVKLPVSQSNTDSTVNTIIGKKGVIFKEMYGLQDKYNQNNQIVQVEYLSASFVDESINVFPYFVGVYNQSADSSSYGKIIYQRSDGIRTLSLYSTSSLVDQDYVHVCVTRSGSLNSLYINGTLHDSGVDPTLNPLNKHSLIFGADNQALRNSFSGSMDEIRIYNYACSPTTVSTLADNNSGSLYQTAVVGNIFYRRGNIILSSLNPKYQNTFRDSTWTANFKSQHTIYQYEVLCRAKKGSFNMTMNPSSFKHPNSDLYSDNMTGSMLMPYATSIGLYTQNGELVAVGKPSQAVQMRGDVDINFIVRWDV